MTRFITGTRYLVIVPVIGLALAAGAFFLFGGLQLILLLATRLMEVMRDTGAVHELPFEVEVIEHVHQFLIGTVLYITAVGLYQLFIQDIEFPGWLRIDSTEDLETNLIGVTVVVLAINFMGIVFTGDPTVILQYGVGMGAAIVALAVFVALRAWSSKLVKSADLAEEEAVRARQRRQDEVDAGGGEAGQNG